MELEFYRIQKLPELKIGDRKNDVKSCKLRVISTKDQFAYAVEIEYIDKRKEEYIIKTMGGEMIAYEVFHTYKVFHKDGMITSVWTFPVRPSLSKEEIDISVSIIPYNEIATGQIKPAILELQKQDVKEEFLGEMITVYSFPLLYFK